jgi:polysaccharide deacetylase family protein (PEP-CTERM system associated)
LDQLPKAETQISNCLSVDVEGFLESNAQSFGVDVHPVSWRDCYELEKNTDSILELFDKWDVQATFFVVGRIATEFPLLVARVASLGHEIACHSYVHVRIFDLARDVFTKNVQAAKQRLEDISGTRVFGFRAPEFSITERSLWALDVLRELGFLYDSSICPTGLHDVYGIRDAKPFVHELANGLVEFPLATFGFCGQRVPFGGGGYLRMYPLVLTERCLVHANRLGHPCMLYVHPYEIGPVLPLIPNLSAYRRFRHYHNCRKGRKRIEVLVERFHFAPAFEILRGYGLLGSEQALSSSLDGDLRPQSKAVGR